MKAAGKPKEEKWNSKRAGWKCIKERTVWFCCQFFKAKVWFLSSQCSSSRIYIQNISISTSFVVQIFCTSDFRFLLSQVENQRLIDAAWWNTWFKWCACHHSQVWIAEDKRILFSRATFVHLVPLRLRSRPYLLQTNALYKTLINSQSIFIVWDRLSKRKVT